MNRRKVFTALGVAAGTLIVTIGVFAANDWFPKTDPMSGQKFGWFGRRVSSPHVSKGSSGQPSNPSATPQLSKEYIYAGSRLLAVEDANAVAAPPADIAVWRPSGGQWWVMGQTGSAATYLEWGISTDIPVPGDYDGDGKTDFAIFRPSTGGWWICYSSTSSYDYFSWGDVSGDKPIAADFDGDGKSDPTIVRWFAAESVYQWWVLKSSGGGTVINWGGYGDVPGAADFDGDGKADVGMFRPSTDVFYWKGSSDGQEVGVWVNDGDIPVPSDYDGDGKADPAVFKNSTAYWYIYQSTTNSLASFQWGTSGDTPVQNDYDGDGKTDLAVWTEQSTDAPWTIKRSSNGTTRTEYWGATGDIPVPAFYRR